MRKLKCPESVLVVVYDQTNQNVLMLQRKDDTGFWQSVSGSLEEDETPSQAAKREVYEELGIDIEKLNLTVINCNYHVNFEIFEQFRDRYPRGVTHCHEHWFLLSLPASNKLILQEHSAYRWMPAKEAMELTKSWNNRQAIEKFIVQMNNK